MPQVKESKSEVESGRLGSVDVLAISAASDDRAVHTVRSPQAQLQTAHVPSALPAWR